MSSRSLQAIDAETWGVWIDAIGPAGLLVAIEHRMSRRLRARYSAEDVLQEALLQVWRDRAQLEWRGLRAFRALVLRAALHRIHDLADSAAALRRGGPGGEPRAADLTVGTHSTSQMVLPAAVATTTPSRVAGAREEARALREALAALPEELAQVLRLRLFEERSTHETAQRLGIGESAVKHRLRKGFGLFSARLGRSASLAAPGD